MEAFKNATGKFLSGGESQAPEAAQTEVTPAKVPADTGTAAAPAGAGTAETARASGGGMSAYLEKAKDAARDYLDKHPVKEGEAQTGLAGYVDKAKLKAKEYLDKDTQGETHGTSGGLLSGAGMHGIVEKLLGMFKKEEGRDLEPGKESDYTKLSAMAKKYLHMDISADTLKTHVDSFLTKFKGGSTEAPTAPAAQATPAAGGAAGP